MYSFLYIAYHAVSLFYLASGCILLASPSMIETKIPKWFPYLGALEWRRVWNSANLIVVGIILLVVGRWLVEKDIAGLTIAILLSAWEVYLSMTFYWKRNEKFSAAYHFVIHIFIVVFVFYTIFAINPVNHVTITIKQSAASVYGIFATNK